MPNHPFRPPPPLPPPPRHTGPRLALRLPLAGGNRPTSTYRVRIPVPTTERPRLELPRTVQPGLRLPRQRMAAECGPGGKRQEVRNTIRRRSQSNDFISTSWTHTTARVSSDSLEDRLFELDTWIRTRRALISTRVDGVQTMIAIQSRQNGVQPDWVNEEVRFVLATLDETERAETEA